MCFNISMKPQEFEKLHTIFEKHNVALAYVFGSVARGVEGPLSDIDIAVLFSGNVPDELQSEQEFSLAGTVGRALKRDRIDIVNLGRIQSPVLKHRAVFFGYPIFAVDNQFRIRFEKQVLEAYEDTKHLRHIAYTTMKQQVKEKTFGKGALSVREKYIIQKHAIR